MAQHPKPEPLTREERAQLPQLDAKYKIVDTFKALETKFNPRALDVTADPFAARRPMNTHFGFKITSDPNSPNDPSFPAHWYVIVQDGRCKALVGISPDAVIVNEMSCDTLEALCFGEITFTHNSGLIKTMLLEYYNEQLDRIFPKSSNVSWPPIELSSAFTGFPSGNKDFGLETKRSKESQPSKDKPPKSSTAKAGTPKTEPSKSRPLREHLSSSQPPGLGHLLKARATTALTVGERDVETKTLQPSNLSRGIKEFSKRTHAKSQSSRPSTARAPKVRNVHGDKESEGQDDEYTLDFKGIEQSPRESKKAPTARGRAVKEEDTAADDDIDHAGHYQGRRLGREEPSIGQLPRDQPWKDPAIVPLSMKGRMQEDMANEEARAVQESSEDEPSEAHLSGEDATQSKDNEKEHSSDELLVGKFEDDWAS